MALLLVLLLAQADPVAQALLEEGRRNNLVMEHLDHLVNRIGPRLTSSDRLTHASEWTRDRFEAFGCSARLEEWGSFPMGFNRGPWSGRMEADGESSSLVCGTMAWMPGTSGPVTGPAVLAPETESELDPGRLRGAWVLVGAGRPSPPGAREDKPAGAGKTLSAERLAAAYDAAPIAGLVRSSRSELIVTAGNYRIDPGKLPKRVVVTVVKSAFSKIADTIREGKAVSLTFDIHNEFARGPIPLYNVIAEIKGAEKPEECVIMGGHLDSWDGATGTTDNGTGVATTLEAARLLCRAGARPRRTIRFMLWSGEEEGLLGSRAWIQAHPEELPRISGVFVHDGGTNYISGLDATANGAVKLEAAFAAVPPFEGKAFTIKKVDQLPRGIGSDHDAFLAAGVPGYFFKQAGRAVYSRTHHTQHDTFSAAIPEYQRHSAVAVALGAWGVSNLSDLLPRDGIVTGDAPRRRLGIQLDDDMGIVEIARGSLAERAGLLTGDRILRAGDVPVKDAQELVAALRKGPKQTKIAVLRNKAEIELQVSFER